MGKYRKWTREDEEVLIALFNKGTNVREIAEVFGIGHGAVKYRLGKLFDKGVLEKRVVYWTEQEVLQFKKHYKNGKTFKEIAKEMDRTFHSIIKKAKHLQDLGEIEMRVYRSDQYDF